MRLLMVENSAHGNIPLLNGLRRAGFSIDALHDGVSADIALQKEAFDLILLETELPYLSGIDVLARARQRGQTVPILMLSSSNNVREKISVLDAGADDILIKSIDCNELAARIRASFRRLRPEQSKRLSCGDVELDLSTYQVSKAGEEVIVSNKEFELLHILLRNSGRVMTREQIEQSLYGWGKVPNSKTMEVHIHHLRKKLGQKFIKTVRHLGYTIPKHTLA